LDKNINKIILKNIMKSFLDSQIGYFKYNKDMNKLQRNILKMFEKITNKNFLTDTSRPNFTNLNTDYEIGKIFYWYFHSHFFKILSTILEIEKNSINQEFLSNLVLNKNKFTIIDIGSGIGTSLIAFFNYIIEVQKEKINQKLTPFIIRLKIIAVEPNKLKIKYLRYSINFYKKILEKYYCYIENFDVIVEEYPSQNCITQIKNSIGNDSQFVYIFFSNILYWLQEDPDSILKHFLRLFLFYFFRKKYESPETRAIKQILELNCIKIANIIFVETEKSFLKRKLKLYLLTLKRTFKKEVVKHFFKNKINFINPKKCVFFDVKNRITNIGSKFFIGHIFYIKSKFVNQKNYVMALKIKNIEESWVKNRFYLKSSDFYDQVQLNLMEINRNELFNQLNYLQNILFYNNFKKGLYLINYKFPKNKLECRPRVFIDFYYQINLFSIIIPIRKFIENYFDNIGKLSYGYRLNLIRKSEYIYQYWFFKYQKYKQIKYSPHFDIILKSDIKNFYPSINQNLLYRRTNEILRFLNIDDFYLKKEFEYIFYRYIIGSKCGYGIYQGLALSGFFANIFLNEFDKKFKINIQNNGRCDFYKRYVDDFFILTNNQNVSYIKNYLENELLLNNKLKVSKNKTFNVKVKKYKRLLDRNKKLQYYSNKLYQLIYPLFKLNKSYMKYYITNPNEFLKLYSLLLKEIGIFISERWLDRKLKTIKYAKKPNHFRRLNFPPFRLNFSKEFKNHWKTTFIHNNINWINEKENLSKELEYDLIKTICYLQTFKPKIKNKINRIRFKLLYSRLNFIIFRFTMLENKNTIKYVKFVSRRPWFINFNLLVKYFILYKCKFEIIVRIYLSKYSYIRAKCIEALPEINYKKSIKILNSVLENRNNNLILLKTIEALIKLDDQTNINLKLIQKLIRKIKDPYILKNIIFLFRFVKSKEFLPFFSKFIKKYKNQILLNAIFYKCIYSENILKIRELPPPFYDKIYPNLEPLSGSQGYYYFYS